MSEIDAAKEEVIDQLAGCSAAVIAVSALVGGLALVNDLHGWKNALAVALLLVSMRYKGYKAGKKTE